ncbi:hypothetical protein RKD31_001018 [Streptomyces sp. SAI-163]
MSTCLVCDNGRMACVRDRASESAWERQALPPCGILTPNEAWAMYEAYEKPEVFDGAW